MIVKAKRVVWTEKEWNLLLYAALAKPSFSVLPKKVLLHQAMIQVLPLSRHRNTDKLKIPSSWISSLEEKKTDELALSCISSAKLIYELSLRIKQNRLSEVEKDKILLMCSRTTACWNIPLKKILLVGATENCKDSIVSERFLHFSENALDSDLRMGIARCSVAVVLTDSVLPSRITEIVKLCKNLNVIKVASVTILLESLPVLFPLP